MPSSTPWRLRSEQEVLGARVEAARRWHDVTAALTDDGESRESRMDAARRQAALQRADAARQAGGARPPAPGVPRAVLVHRREWVRDRVTALLVARGVAVVASLGDGAEGLGAVVAEQPDLVLVEDVLPSLSGVEIVRSFQLLAPDTLVAAQVDHPASVERLRDAGAAAVLTRAAPPAEVADTLTALVAVG